MYHKLSGQAFPPYGVTVQSVYRKQISPLGVTDVAHRSLRANKHKCRRKQDCLRANYKHLRQWLEVMEAEGSRLTGAQTFRLLLPLKGRSRSNWTTCSVCLHHLKSYLHTSATFCKCLSFVCKSFQRWWTGRTVVHWAASCIWLALNN